MLSLQFSASSVLASPFILLHVYPSLIVTLLAAAQQVIELIAAIKKVPDQFQCAFLSFFFVVYSTLTTSANLEGQLRCLRALKPFQLAQSPQSMSVCIMYVTVY